MHLARAQAVFEQSLPLYRQTSEKLGVILNATVGTLARVMNRISAAART